MGCVSSKHCHVKEGHVVLVEINTSTHKPRGKPGRTSPPPQRGGAVLAFETLGPTEADEERFEDALPPLTSALTRCDSSRSLVSVYYDCVDQSEAVEVFLESYCSTPTSSADGSAAAPAAERWSFSSGFTDRWSLTSGGHATATSRGARCTVAPAEPPVEHVLRQYKQGEIFICKAVAELLAYWKTSGLSLDQVEAQLREAERRADARTALHSGTSSSSQAADGRQQQHHQHKKQGTEGDEERQQDVQQQNHHHQQHNHQQQQPPLHEQQQHTQHHHHQQQQHSRLRPHKRWAPTSGDSLTPGIVPLPASDLGIGGGDLFSASHLAGHLRAAADLLKREEQSRSWRQVAKGPLQLWHHHDKERGLQHFKVHCVMDESLLNMLCVCREVDLCTGWNPTISAMKTMIQASLSELLVYMGIWLPWPLREPEMLIRALGMDLLSTEGCYLITLQDVGDTLPPNLQLGPGSESRTRYHLHPSCFRFTPLPPDPATGKPRVEVVVLASLDSKKVHVNDTIVSFLLKVFAPVVHRSITQTCVKLFNSGDPEDSPLLRRQGERADLYLSQARSIDKYLRARGWQDRQGGQPHGPQGGPPAARQPGAPAPVQQA